MQKSVFMVILVFAALVLFAQAENKSPQQTPSRTKVKEGVKMYELKVDNRAGVVIVDSKTEKKEEQKPNSAAPVARDTANGRR